MQEPRKAVVRHADSLFFYAEHGAVLVTGLYFVCRYVLERFQSACFVATFHGCQLTESNVAVSSSYLLISIPLIAISLARMLLFYSCRKQTEPDPAPQLYTEPTVRMNRGPYVLKRSLQSGSGR